MCFEVWVVLGFWLRRFARSGFWVVVCYLQPGGTPFSASVRDSRKRGDQPLDLSVPDCCLAAARSKVCRGTRSRAAALGPYPTRAPDLSRSGCAALGRLAPFAFRPSCCAPDATRSGSARTGGPANGRLTPR